MQPMQPKQLLQLLLLRKVALLRPALPRSVLLRELVLCYGELARRQLRHQALVSCVDLVGERLRLRDSLDDRPRVDRSQLLRSVAVVLLQVVVGV
jgi:hypothetical protein